MRIFWILSFCLLASIPTLAMTAGPHMAVGASLGKVSGNPASALGLGMASHVLLDVLPHNDDSKWLQAISLAAALWTTNQIYEKSQKDPKVLWGVAGGLLPDLEHLLAQKGLISRKQKIFPTHNGTIPQGKRLEPDIALTLELGATGIALHLVF